MELLFRFLNERLKNGSWSVGKELSVRELINLDVPGLDSVDQRIKEGIFSWEYSIYIEKYLYLLLIVTIFTLVPPMTCSL